MMVIYRLSKTSNQIEDFKEMMEWKKMLLDN